jgi:hypothetical protein
MPSASTRGFALESRACRIVPILAIATFLLSLQGPLPACAQSGVVGRAIDLAARAGVAGVRISAHDERGTQTGVTESDSIGHFRLRLSPGKYKLRAVRVGYQSAETMTFEFSEDEQLEVVLQMTVQPFSMEPLVIVGSRTTAGHLKEYYERLDRDSGRGRFITRTQIVEMDAPGITSYMEQYGVPMHMNLRGGEKWPLGVGRCRMRVFLDGTPIDGFVIDDLVRPADVEGVEVYRSAYEAPPQYSSRTNTCGIVLIWTRMDRRDAIPFWRGLLMGVGTVAIIALLRQWWTQ